MMGGLSIRWKFRKQKYAAFFSDGIVETSKRGGPYTHAFHAACEGAGRVVSFCYSLAEAESRVSELKALWGKGATFEIVEVFVL